MLGTRPRVAPAAALPLLHWLSGSSVQSLARISPNEPLIPFQESQT